MMNRSTVNPWPGFSDLMFMLALTTLLIAAGVVAETRRQQQDLQALRAATDKVRERLKELGVDPDAPQDCGLATPVVEAMQRCLVSNKVPVERRGCSLSVEGAIHFGFNRTELAPDAARSAARVAECVIVGAQQVSRFAALEGAGLDAISIEGHADACGYRDWSRLMTGGMEQPARRAKVVYDLVFAKVVSVESGFDEAQKARILGRIATRSFGPYRPLAGVVCDCAHPDTCRGNRRVEIVVQGQLGNTRPNWAPSTAIYFGAGRPMEPQAMHQEGEPQ